MCGDEREDGSRIGFDDDFTQGNTAILARNLMHLARLPKDARGISSYANDRA